MDEHNTQNNQEELEKCKEQAEEYLNNWKRERADFINYKKDETKRIEEFLKFGTEGIIMELLNVIDAVEVARKNVPQLAEIKDWLEGFDSSLEKLDKFLSKFGVEKIKVEGAKFDPNFHEAVFAESGEFLSDGVNFDGSMQEVRPGYIMYGKVIRPARVKIIK